MVTETFLLNTIKIMAVLAIFIAFLEPILKGFKFSIMVVEYIINERIMRILRKIDEKFR